MAGSLMDVFVKIGADTSGLESGIQKTKGLASGLASGIGNAVSTGLKVAGAAIGAATTAVAGFAASSVEVGKTFDASMSQVAATMGVTKDEITDLEAFAKEMGRTTAFSATQAAEALNYMALAGYDADTSMKMLPNVLNLAAAGGMELAQASDMVTDAQTALGLSLDQTTELVDMMALTSSKTNTSVTQLGDAILTIGGTAKIMAGGTTELNTMLGVLADNGIKGSEAGTKLRNVLLSLSAPTDTAAAKLAELHVDTIDETTGDLRALDDIMQDLDKSLEGMGTAEKAEVINTIFNKQDIAAVNALLDTSADRYDQLQAEINGAWIASKNFENGFKGTHLENMQKNLEKAGVSVDDFNMALKNSKGNAGQFANTMAELTGMDVNGVLETMGTNLRMLQTEFDHVEGSAEQMAQTQLDNLAGDITLWKSAMEGAQLLISGALAPELREFVKFGTDGLSKISDAFEKDGLSGAMEAFKEVLSEGIAMVTKKIPDFINAGMELLGAFGQGIIDNLPQIVDAAVQIGVMFVDGIVKAAPELIKGAGTLIKSLKDSFSKNKDSLSKIGGDFITLMVDGFKSGMSGLAGIITDIASFFSENAGEMANTAVVLVNGLVEGMTENLPTIIEGLGTIIESIAQALTDPGTLTPLFEGAMKVYDSVLSSLVEGAPQVGQYITSLLTQLLGFITEGAPTLIEGGVQLTTSLAEGFVEGIPGLITSAADAIISLALALTDPASITSMIQAAMDLMMALANGLLEAIPKLVDAIPQIISNLVAALVAAIPQIIFAGIYLLVALGTGLIQAIPRLVAMIPAIILALVGGLKRGIDQIVQVGRDMVAGLWRGIKERWEGLVRDVQNLAGGLVDGVKNLFGIKSPSRVFAEIGRQLDAGLAKGINDNVGLVDKAMSKLEGYTNFEANGEFKSSLSDMSAPNGDVVRLLQEIANKDFTVVLEGDSERLFRVVQRESRRNNQITGQPSFA